MPHHVTIDSHHIAHADGKPFFLIGARHMPEGGTTELLREAGFNGYRLLVFGHDVSVQDAIPEGPDGLYFWAYLYDRADLSKGREAELREMIVRLRDNPLLLCYENLNEPALYYPDRPLKAEPEALAHGTAVVRELDPRHPIWLAHACFNTVETLQRFNPCCDIVGSNPYPVLVPGMRQHIGARPDGRMLDCPDQSVHAVGAYTQKMLQVGQGRPAWMFVQALANEHWYNPMHTPEMAEQGIDERMVRYPTYHEMRFMAYDAIVSGATGLAFSMYKTPVGGEVWQDITRLVAELRDLHDLLCAPPHAQPVQLTYTDLGFTIWDGVRTLLRSDGQTATLFAVNTQFDPMEVTFSNLPVASGTLTVVNEGRTVNLQQGRFTDHFEPYGVHVYRCGDCTPRTG